MKEKSMGNKEPYSTPECEAYLLGVSGCICSGGGTGTGDDWVVPPEEVPGDNYLDDIRFEL
ncbi:MAG: hypothetical protein IJ151_07295 [Bacteroidales bacterium]|nr:hypothetical protein [Bacteroidales bacterium]